MTVAPATLYCICGCEIRPHELRGHHLRCTRIQRAKRRIRFAWRRPAA